MNKAFVRESDGDEEEESLEPALKLPQGTRNYITPGGHARIKSELDHLLRTERPQVVEVVHWAASNGDRSENGDYIYGKRRLREIDRRIRFLTKRLELAEVVHSAGRDSDQVFFGATVLLLRGNGQEQTVSIVGVDEIDLPRNRISWISPLARVLLKAREGDSVVLRGPEGDEDIEILEVRYEVLD